MAQSVIVVLNTFAASVGLSPQFLPCGLRPPRNVSIFGESVEEDWQQAVLGSFLTTRMDMRLSGPPEAYVPDNATIGSTSTYIHEHVHLFQTLFTGYGHIAWDSHRQASGFVFNAWQGLIQKGGVGARVPLAHYWGTNPGQGYALHAYVTVVEQMRLGRAKFAHPDPGATLKSIGSQLVPKPWPINPTVKSSGGSRVLQTKDILEGHAHFVERTWVERFVDGGREAAWSRDGIGDQYTDALDWFIERCGNERRNEFPALCDLALQTIWKPVLPATEDDWQKSNPSWRFVKLVDVLASSPDLSLGSADRWPETYARFSNELLLRCGFATLAAVYDERMASFARRKELLAFERLMKKGIEFKHRTPWCNVNPAADLDLLEIMMREFKAPIVVVEGQLGTFGLGSVPGSEIVMELHHQALFSQLMGDFSSEARRTETMACAFAKYGIGNVCEHQINDGCPGRFNPAQGLPFPARLGSGNQVLGCTFGWQLKVMGLESEDILLNHQAVFPNLPIAP